jgi:hypothetical protein
MMKRFLLATFLVIAFSVSAALCLSASASPSSGWAGKHHFTLIAYNAKFMSGVAVIEHNTLCEVRFRNEHHLPLGTVFTSSIYGTHEYVGDTHKPICAYDELSYGQAPIKVVGHASTVTVKSAIGKPFVSSRNKYQFAQLIDSSGRIWWDATASYPVSAVQAVHRVEASGKVVTILLRISKGGPRHIAFVR